MPTEQVKDSELLIDVIEELHGRINNDGLPIDTYITGDVAVLVNLPKNPEISFQLRSTIAFSDVSFHQCALDSISKGEVTSVRFFAQNGPINVASFIIDSLVVSLPFKMALEFKDDPTSPYIKASLSTEMVRGQYYRLQDFEVKFIFPEYSF